MSSTTHFGGHVAFYFQGVAQKWTYVLPISWDPEWDIEEDTPAYFGALASSYGLHSLELMNVP